MRLEGDGHASGLKGFALERLSSRELRRLALGRFKSGRSNCYSKQWLEHRLNVGSQCAGGLECAGAALVSTSGLRSTVSMSISAKRPWPAAPAAASITLRVTSTARCPASTASCACGERSAPMCIRSRPCALAETSARSPRRFPSLGSSNFTEPSGVDSGIEMIFTGSRRGYLHGSNTTEDAHI